MPTPVATARQCLTPESAAALDDAVLVAKRRNHAQTTSLHLISALLSPSFSLLRDALSRARSTAYSPRLQLRALDLCVSVSLDRLPSSKSPENEDFAPPISNSLMAAIKRSQANQRRQPDIYLLNQINHSNSNNNINCNNSSLSISSIKVELKHFVLSILDDPIVSRVFGEAGFRSSDIKFAVIHPPRWSHSSAASTTRCPPLFLCNFMDFTAGNFVAGVGAVDENCKRIVEAMVRSKERRNPVLIGACAYDALSRFKDDLINNRKISDEFSEVKLVCLEREIKERDRKSFEIKLNEAKSISKLPTDSDSGGSGGGGGGGVVVNLGELKVLVNNDDEEDNDSDYVNEVVIKVKELIEESKKVWLILATGNYETYSKFVGKFTNVEKDWDLQPLPITASSSSSTYTTRSSFDPKSSLMGSFVPFGGFFPTSSDFRPPLTAVRPLFTRCNTCNESYERELSATLREGSSVSVADEQSSSLPSWLQSADPGVTKPGNVVTQVKDVSNEKVLCLQKKWDDHCRLVHQNYPFAVPAVSVSSLQIPRPHGFQLMADMQCSRSSSGESSLNERACSNSSCGMQIVVQNISPQNQVVKADYPRRAVEVSEHRPSPREFPVSGLSMPVAQKSPSTASVTTDLGLGMVDASKCDNLKKPYYQDRQLHYKHSLSSLQIKQGPLGKKQPVPLDLASYPSDPNEYKPLLRKLSEAASWQGEAICKIAEIVSNSKSGNGHPSSANSRGNIWLNFLGPDRIGKKRVAQALADALLGSRDRLIAVNLSPQEKTTAPNSLFLSQASEDFDINTSRVTIVDRIAQELCRKPHSVVFLENVDEADHLVQHSLSDAIQTGKFRVPSGREVGINNVVFVTTTSLNGDSNSLSPRKEFIKFLEEKILEAKNWQMQLGVKCVPGDAFRSNETTVSLLPPKCNSDRTKRKQSCSGDSSEDTRLAKRANKMPKNSLDLNLPLEESEENVESDSCDNDFGSDGSWLQDFFSQVHGNVAFKPFDFDALADSLVRKIRAKFQETFKGERISLEIDHEVMLQILAASWCTDNKAAIDEWIEQVLGTNLAEAREKYRLTADSVFRLGSCEGVVVKEWASGICLPKTINLSI